MTKIVKAFLLLIGHGTVCQRITYNVKAWRCGGIWKSPPRKQLGFKVTKVDD
jgi:hypothetical protein